MDSKVLASGVGCLVALAAGLVWWILGTTPTQTAIDAGRQQPPALPVINLQLLSNGTLSNRTSNGILPIQVEGIGRPDPFAGA